MLLPWIVTSAPCPRLTSLMKSENGRLACGPRVEDVWNRLNNATSNKPMMIQSARFLPKLFTNPGLSFRAGRKNHAGRLVRKQTGAPALLRAEHHCPDQIRCAPI